MKGTFRSEESVEATKGHVGVEHHDDNADCGECIDHSVGRVGSLCQWWFKELFG